ncbi:stalk domain-containing protein [Ammoniphilus sp. 3BR4]|uniref:stalk domain-containing protein n=1 Tax=Ammoniphilus sp. 3BR4 TaxID=3158265 RepID=UPI003466E967
MRTFWYMLSFLLCFLCFTTITQAHEKVIEVYVNNQPMSFDRSPPFIKEGTTMVPLRSIAETLGVQVDWDEKSNMVTLQGSPKMIKLGIDQLAAEVNGQTKRLQQAPIIYNDRTYVPLRFISEELDKQVEWEPSQSIIFIADNQKESDIYWLAKLVEAEASGEPYQGKVAVAAVILNRTNSTDFPKTIKSVIFEEAQFTPVATKRIFSMTPKDGTIRAVREAMEGADPTLGALYFFNPGKTDNRFLHSRSVTMTIGNHRFVT